VEEKETTGGIARVDDSEPLFSKLISRGPSNLASTIFGLWAEAGEDELS